MSIIDKFIRVKLITNPRPEAASKAADNLELITGHLKKNGLKADEALDKPKAKATPLARQAIKDGYKIVIAMAGDGTGEAVMHGMVGRKAHLGIVPTGMENNITKSLGIHLDLEAACALIASDNTRGLDVTQVKTGKGKPFPFFEMAGIGLSSDLLPDKISSVSEDPSITLKETPAPL